MSLRHGLLGLIKYKPMTGYELTKEFNQSLGYFWHSTSQQIYKELDMMEKSGWLVSERVIQSEKPNKRVYSITAKGKEELLAWLSTPEDDIKTFTQGKNVFLMRLAFMGETNDALALEMLQNFKNQYLPFAQSLDDIEKIIAKDEVVLGSKVMKYWRIVALHGEILHKARLEWVEKAIEILENKREEFHD